ncbi:MAG: hypothetical protein ACYCTE_16150 [Acidimicrobiales bacterium]
MARNAYLGLAMLATYPAFSFERCELVCPLCLEFATRRVAEYDAHFLGHEPSRADAERWLSGRRYEQLALSNGWLERCPGSGAVVTTRVVDLPWSAPRTPRYVSCGACGASYVRVVRDKVRAHSPMVGAARSAPVG